MAVPHPFPYQGSKRGIAPAILSHIPRDTDRLIEPFCGSGAVSIAAAARGLARVFSLNDVNQPLMKLWASILEDPERLAKGYETLWHEQQADKKDFFFRIRDEFNFSHQSHHFLYLLARIVKGSVRYSADGQFNQSADNRRSGMRPERMRHQILGVSALLAGRTTLSALDFREVVTEAQKDDLVYMDPPYQGTSFTRDHRYYNGLAYDEFVDALSTMIDRNIPFIISYDGYTGEKSHGRPLPNRLDLTHLNVHAGRSSQATLLGSDLKTIESLYLSPALAERLNNEHRGLRETPKWKQKELALA